MKLAATKGRSTVKRPPVSVDKLNIEFQRIKVKYEERHLPSKIYNDIYYAACFYDTMMRDLTKLYKLNIDYYRTGRSMFSQQFLGRREAEIIDFGSNLYNLFGQSKRILDETSSYHESLLNNISIVQTRSNNRFGGQGTINSHAYKDLMSRAESIRYKIENMVYAWRKRIDFELNDFGMRTSNLITKEYFPLNDPSPTTLSTFAEKMENFIRRTADQPFKQRELLNIFKDIKESGELLAGGVMTIFLKQIASSSQLKEEYARSHGPEHVQDFKPPDLDYIGPFKFKPIPNATQIFKINTTGPVKVEEACYVSMRVGRSYVLLNSTSVTNVTLPDEAKFGLGIPIQSKYFCYIYPSIQQKPSQDSQYIEYFKHYGGFLYFNQQRTEVVGAVALEDLDRVCHDYRTPGLLFFSYPFRLDRSQYDTRNIMFNRCTFDSVKNSKIKPLLEKFAWVNPGALGFKNDGCFMFQNSRGEVTYFNLLAPRLGQLVHAQVNDDSSLTWEYYTNTLKALATPPPEQNNDRIVVE